MILTAKHLAVVRAALEYWNDEMGPHDPSIYTAYFDEPVESGDWIKEIVAELRTRLPTCRLRYVLCSPDGAKLVDQSFFETLNEIPQTFFTDLNLVATAVISETAK